ncbi:MAG: hypothetical protein ABH856_05060 [Patescibacteria group bacterium]|nr:hypothetical protein [Patescibacteria group bacterium]
MMMYYYGGMGAGYLWPLHGLFCLLFSVGLVLLVVWMIKNLDKKMLFKWAAGLLVVGVLGGLVLGFAGKYGWKNCTENEECKGHMDAMKEFMKKDIEEVAE